MALNRLIIVFSVALTTIALMATITGCASPEEKAGKLYATGKYEEVISLYPSSAAADSARAKRAEILFKEKKYGEVIVAYRAYPLCERWVRKAQDSLASVLFLDKDYHGILIRFPESTYADTARNSLAEDLYRARKYADVLTIYPNSPAAAKVKDSHPEAIAQARREEEVARKRMDGIRYEVVRQWDAPCAGRGGIMMDILVDGSATREEVMTLARSLRAKHSDKGCIFFWIFDSREAWLDKVDVSKNVAKLRLSEKEYWRHFLVFANRNINTGLDAVDWVAEGRDH